MHHLQTNPPISTKESFTKPTTKCIISSYSNNALAEAQHPSHNVLAEALLSHNATTTEAQQNLLHQNTTTGVRCPDNNIMLPNNPEVNDDNTEGTPSLSVRASYLWFQGQNDLHTPSEGGGVKDPPDEPEVKEFISKLS